MRNWPWSLLIAVTALGLLLGTQTQLQFRARQVAASGRPDEAAALLKASEQKRQALEAEIDRLRKQLTQPAAASDPPEPDRRTIILAGTTAVEGPGVWVRLEEGASVVNTQPNPHVYRLHDEDVLKVVNELFAAGAEAVSVNGQRMVAISEVRNAANAIMINGTPTTPPYTLLAIGDPGVLEASLRMRGGIVDVLKLWDIQVTMQGQAKISIPPYQSLPVFRHAQPTPPGGSAPGGATGQVPAAVTPVSAANRANRANR